MEEVPVADDETTKRGFFGRLLRFAFLAAAIGAVVSAVRRRDGLDLDEDEWQELPPPPSA